MDFVYSVQSVRNIRRLQLCRAFRKTDSAYLRPNSGCTHQPELEYTGSGASASSSGSNPAKAISLSSSDTNIKATSSVCPAGFLACETALNGEIGFGQRAKYSSLLTKSSNSPIVTLRIIMLSFF